MSTVGNGRVVVVAGGGKAGSIGGAIAKSFLQIGDDVILSDIGKQIASHPDYVIAPPDSLEGAVAELSGLGTFVPVAFDVTNESEVAALFDKAEMRHPDCCGVAFERAGIGSNHVDDATADVVRR